MKREGRQHGMVRCLEILPQLLNSRPEPRYINRFDSRPTTKLLTRVSNKPTNHSKFSGKCGRPRCRGCHESPVCKSKVKAKGTQKLRSRNVARMVMWGVADAKPGWRLSGFSATGFLDQIDREAYGEYIDDCVDGVYEESGEIASLAVDLKDHDEDECEIKGFDGDDEICDVEFVWYDWICYEDEDWCFVEETF